MKVKQSEFQLEPLAVPAGANVIKSVKRYHDVAFLYENPRTDDPVVYEVYTCQAGDLNASGNLFWGLTVLKPVYSNDECNMTRGHFHADRDCAEYYFCTKGEGLLLLMDESGNTWAEEMRPGSLHHIDGHVAHRCVNTGEEDLYVGACWPMRAGHDYDAVPGGRFGCRIKKINGQLVYEES